MHIKAIERHRAVERLLRRRLMGAQNMAGDAPPLDLAEFGEMLQIGDIVERLVGVDLGDRAATYEQPGFARAGFQGRSGVIERAGIGPQYGNAFALQGVEVDVAVGLRIPLGRQRVGDLCRYVPFAAPFQTVGEHDFARINDAVTPAHASRF